MSPLEGTLLVLCGATLAVLLWLYVVPLELEGELRRERGAGMAGHLRVKLGLASLLAVPAEGRSWRLELILCGVRLVRWETSPREERAPAPKEEEAPPGQAGTRSLVRALRHWDLGDLLRFLIDHRHLLVVRALEGRLEFGFEDPALTGEFFGYGCAARQISSAFAGVELVPLWTFENGCWGWLRGGIRARLVALLMALALYLVTHYRRVPSAAAAGARVGGGAAAT